MRGNSHNPTQSDYNHSQEEFQTGLWMSEVNPHVVFILCFQSKMTVLLRLIIKTRFVVIFFYLKKRFLINFQYKIATKHEVVKMYYNLKIFL